MTYKMLDEETVNAGRENPKTGGIRKTSFRRLKNSSPDEVKVPKKSTGGKNRGPGCSAKNSGAQGAARFPGSVAAVCDFAREAKIEDEFTARWLYYNERQFQKTGCWPISSSWRAALRNFTDDCVTTSGADGVPKSWEPDSSIWCLTSDEVEDCST